MATYGYDLYGESTYGPTAPTGNYPGSTITVPVVNTAYIFPGIAATVQDYGNILVTWGPLNPGTNATVTEFRLVSNTWGFPVDQNDGTVVIDVTGAPPSYPYLYVDMSASPGTVQYYGIYVLSNGTWLRGGFAAVLMPYYNGYDVKLMQDLPAFFQSQDLNVVVTDIPVNGPTLPASGSSTTNPYDYAVDVWLSEVSNVLLNGLPIGEQTFFTLPANGTVTISYTAGTTWQWIQRAEQGDNSALPQFLAIVGMGLDLIKSQYDQKFNSLNNPMTMSLGDLENFCAEIGLPYNPELPAYTTRKAALYWGRVMQERGTLAGIAEHITLLTGYQADIQTSRNIMLDDDQSEPADPVTHGWSANMSYVVGNLVTFPVAQQWSVVSTYNVGSVVMYNDQFYTCTVANTISVPPTNTANWSQTVEGPYLYVCILANENQQPSGSLSATSYWTAVYGGDKSGAEYNVPVNISGLASNSGTWEFTNAAGAAYASAMGVGFPTPQAWPEGSSTPSVGVNGYGNTFRVNNNTGSTITNALLRSVGRSTAGATANALYPDPQLVVEHSVPVPSGVLPWSSTTTYQTNDIVSAGNVNFIALRQSTGAKPPALQSVLNQNYDFESSITPWLGNNATVTQSTTFAYHGTHSMSVVSTAAEGFAFSENVSVIPGATYEATALVYAPTSTPQVQLAANWYDPFGTYITGVFNTVTLANATWTALSTLFTVPSNASTAFISPTNIASGVTTYWDLVELTCVATPEWAPLGNDVRLPITMSGYGIADLGFTPTTSTTVTPFAEFYDHWGNIITRVFARTSSTSGGYPTNYQYDGFDTGAGFPVSGRVPAIPTSVWSVPIGTWTVSTNGIAYAGTSDADAIGVVASPAQGTTAITIANAAQPGDDCGALFWYENTSNFWVAGLAALYYVESATTRVISYTGTAPAVGDRIYAQYNNTTSTTTLPNTTTLVGPSVIVYKNSLTTSNILVLVGSGGTSTHTAVSSLTSPYLPSTSATTSNAGIASIAT